MDRLDLDRSPSERIDALRDAQQAVLSEIIEMAKAQYEGRPVNRGRLEHLHASVCRFWFLAAHLFTLLRARRAEDGLIRRAKQLADFFEQIEDEVVRLLGPTSERDGFSSS